MRCARPRSSPPRATVQPWQAAPITDDMLRSPINIIPPDQRPRVLLRFADQKELLVSGLLDGGSDIVAALRRIADAKAPFVARGDDSGTSKAELRFWNEAGIDPKATGAGW